jgi:hypothetical protein
MDENRLFASIFSELHVNVVGVFVQVEQVARRKQHAWTAAVTVGAKQKRKTSSRVSTLDYDRTNKQTHNKTVLHTVSLLLRVFCLITVASLRKV